MKKRFVTIYSSISNVLSLVQAVEERLEYSMGNLFSKINLEINE